MVHKKYEMSFGIHTEAELWKCIHELSDIRAQYSIFDSEEEYWKHHACGIGIEALRTIMGVDNVVRPVRVDKPR